METITTQKAPQAIGPYSQAVKYKNILFISGQIAIDPSTNQLIKGDIKDQTELIMQNLGEILKAAGYSYKNIAKTEIFLTNLSHFDKVNEVYKSFLAIPYPARVTVGVSELPKGAKIEIAVTAL